jgi:hypothetical protein
MLDEETYLVQAQINLEDFNEVLHINLPLTKKYQTLGGFLLYQWQKIPSMGETFNYDNLEFTVMSVTGPRLHQIQVRRLGRGGEGGIGAGGDGGDKKTGKKKILPPLPTPPLLHSTPPLSTSLLKIRHWIDDSQFGKSR